MEEAPAMGRHAGEDRSGRAREGCLRELQVRDGVAGSPHHICGHVVSDMF